jgi:hypothetical protein
MAVQEGARPDNRQRLREYCADRNIIWHYTGWDGLSGILERKDKDHREKERREIWLSDAAFLNDSRELQHGIDAVRDAMSGTAHKWAFQQIWGISQLAAQSYVASFSRRCDDLGQWRGYSGGVDGFSMGFDRARLTEIARHHDAEVFDCQYAPRRQEQIVRKLVEEFDALRAEMDRDQYEFRALKTIYYRVARLAAQLKDPSFAAEREIRLCCLRTQNLGLEMDFRKRGALKIPFLKMPLRAPESRFPVRVIVVGPGPHMDLMKSAVSELVIKHRLPDDDGIDVVESRVPYRAW